MESARRQNKQSIVSIVARGIFTPAIFHPQWFFKAEKLFGEQEIENAKVEIIHVDIAKMKIGDISIQIMRDSLNIFTADARSFEQLKDVVTNIFTLLDRTPVAMMGVNYDTHFVIEDAEKWHELGHLLAPKPFWENFVEKPGMQSLTMESKNPFHNSGYIRTKVEPSAEVTNGVHVQVNNHFNIKSSTPIDQTAELISILNNFWFDIEENSTAILNNIKNFDKKK